MFINNNIKKQYWNLFKVVCSNIFYSHQIATFLFIISYTNVNQNWLTKFNIDSLPWSEKYLYAYYWATTIITTVGFGDITPANPY